MIQRAYRLMKEWCDTLLSYEVRTKTPYTDGALLCPACHVIHGRIADLCFPLTLLWVRTGEARYLEAADRMIDWSEYNLKTPDGIWYNDAGSRWYGITAFSAMAIGESLYHFGDKIPKTMRKKWQAIFFRLTDGFAALRYRASFRPVSNYYCGGAALLAMAWRLSGKEKYREEAQYWLDVAMSRFDGDGLLYGEGAPLEESDGSRPIDMGYNLEESLPLLLRYAQLTGDREAFFRRRLHDHLMFLLPDGAIDNSFGSRHNKWTYWGSRTSDGVIEGLALVLDDPVFYEACRRALTLYERYTHEGLLAMPMAPQAGEPTCLHHTFTHAKALAMLVCAKEVQAYAPVLLPCEEKFGVKSYQNGTLKLVSHGAFRATFSANRVIYKAPHTSNQGGSMNLLYVEGYGPLCAANTSQYVPVEPLNQQYLRTAEDGVCMTAQFVVNGKQGSEDREVVLCSEGLTVSAKAKEWTAEYTFSQKELGIRLSCEDGVYQFPLICDRDVAVALSEDAKELRLGDSILISSDLPLQVDVNRRVFHQVGGFLYLPVSLAVKGMARIAIVKR